MKKAVFTHIILKYKSGDRSVKCEKRLIHWGAVQRNLFYLVYLESGFCNNISSQPVGVLPTKQLISNRTFSQFVRELCAKMLGARVLWFIQCHLYYEYIRIIIYITIVPAVVPIRIGIIANHVSASSRDTSPVHIVFLVLSYSLLSSSSSCSSYYKEYIHRCTSWMSPANK